MSQTTAHLTVARQWDFLEPAMDPNSARTDHIKLTVPGSGTTVAYPAGQVVCQKDDGTNEWAKIGTSGFTGPKRIIKYAVVINDAGLWQHGSSFVTGQESFSGSLAAYWKGVFKTQDLTGLTDNTVMATVGALLRGTRTAGIISVNAQGPQGPQGPGA